MKQETSIKIMSEDKKISLYCDMNVSLGMLHDFLLLLKGNIVERMVKAQKEEEESSKEQEKKEEPKKPVVEVPVE